MISLCLVLQMLKNFLSKNLQHASKRDLDNPAALDRRTSPLRDAGSVVNSSYRTITTPMFCDPHLTPAFEWFRLQALKNELRRVFFAKRVQVNHLVARIPSPTSCTFCSLSSCSLEFHGFDRRRRNYCKTYYCQVDPHCAQLLMP